MKRKASCHCGQLQVVCEGDPTQVIMCHCELCQRRTGTSYNLGAWFNRSDVTVEGEERTYRRTGDEGLELIFHFCPRCGTNIYWELPAALADMFGVAVGCFADPDFPGPTVSLYGKRRHAWLTQPGDIPSHISGVGSDLE